MNLRAIVMTLVCAAVSIVTMYGFQAVLGGPDTETKTVEVATTVMSAGVTAPSAPSSSAPAASSSSSPSQSELADAAAQAAEDAARSAARSSAEEAAKAIVEEALANR